MKKFLSVFLVGLFLFSISTSTTIGVFNKSRN